ncbi:MAG TPA: VOC family protein [Kofleriaceae bacterium]|nr:VOC family protein [Kofleriaceae bacterium]
MKILFVASFSPIISDPAASHAFYRGALGLPLDKGEGDYVFSESLPGAKHFGLWPLAEAARASFGTPDWPSDVKVPQACLELEVDDVAAAAAELESGGHRLLHGSRTEPWGQTVARLLSPEGLLIGVCHTPWLRDKTAS